MNQPIFKQTPGQLVKVRFNSRVGKQLGLIIREEFVSFAEHATKMARKCDQQSGVMKMDS